MAVTHSTTDDSKGTRPSVEELYAAAVALPSQERARLADLLVADLGAAPLSPAWEAEIRRRLEAYDRGETKAIPGDQVMQELKAKYGW